MAQDPVVRRKIAKLAVMVETGKMLDTRCLCEAVKPDYVPNVEAAMNKMWGGIAETVLSDEAADLLGPYGYLWGEQEHAPMHGDVVDDYLWAGHQRVAAAGVDISKNIIAQRHLGLPR
jgi:alkylation response protein AidB-like acyl-CoA dehydrogenase